MDFKLPFKLIWQGFRSCILRNKTIIKATILAFCVVMVASMFLTAFAFYAAPWLFEWVRSLMESERRHVAVPPPFTEDLYFYILSNNIGHFWNPLKMLVWVPLFGTFVLGLEILFNSALIGALSVVLVVTHGAFYPIKGLMPHGVLEIPALILQFASITRWHVTNMEMIMAKVTGERVDGARFKRGIKDSIILAVASVVLLSVAASVEAFITPSFLENELLGGNFRQ